MAKHLNKQSSMKKMLLKYQKLSVILEVFFNLIIIKGAPLKLA
jgi:hypothetical protein